MSLGITIREMEDFVNTIKILLEKQESHMDWLMAKRIQFLNKKFKNFDTDIDEMIKESQRYIDHYALRLGQYEEYLEEMKFAKN